MRSRRLMVATLLAVVLLLLSSLPALAGWRVLQINGDPPFEKAFWNDFFVCRNGIVLGLASSENVPQLGVEFRDQTDAVVRPFQILDMPLNPQTITTEDGSNFTQTFERSAFFNLYWSPPVNTGDFLTIRLFMFPNDPNPTNSDTVEVADCDLPVLPALPNIVVNATSPGGAVVNYDPGTATDPSGPLPVVCNPPPGSLFPVGQTTVTCSATNANVTVSTTFTVTVLGPDAQLARLYQDAGKLTTIAPRYRLTIQQQISNAQTSLANGDVPAACRSLDSVLALINRIYYGQTRPAAVVRFVNDVKRIKGALGC